jgi:4-amino-4-deoxy-L-arabinose transferase-like glycosyltransferase
LHAARPPLSIAAARMRLPTLDSLTERQTSLLVILFGLIVYLPFAGSYGLYDPWETHYSEVARQMAVRGDYISLWWPGAPIDPDHFWSKPVLSFWLMSLTLRLFGLGDPAAGTFALSTRAEWAVRLPFLLAGVMGIYAVYLCVSRFVNRRAAIFAAVVTATSPLYALVSRQAMTDMAFVGPMTMALALGALALFDDQDVELPRRSARIGKATLAWPHHPLFYVAIGLLTLTALPQIVVDAIQLDWSFHVARHVVTIPGAVLMLPFLAGFMACLLLTARFRYKAPLYLHIAATLCGLATLAKGLAGLGLPVLVFLAYLGFTSNWKRLSRAQLGMGILIALLACALVAVPWHQAMLLRHGKPFWDELYGDNHWRRLMVGRHGDRGTFEYFLRELGYAVLPWIALAPSALAALVMRRADPSPAGVRRQGMLWFGAVWFVGAYALVSLSVTKFHHYILPALPGLAIVIGCFLDDLLRRRDVRAAALAAVVGVPLLALVTADLATLPKDAQRFIWLFSYDYVNAPGGRPWPAALDFRAPLIVFAALMGVTTLALAWPRLQRAAAVALCLVAVAFTFFLLDGYMRQVTPYWTQKGLIATYYKQRRSPEERLVVWQMYWRGENFYTANEIYEGPKDQRTIFLGDRNLENMKAWMEHHRNQRAFFLVERSRYGTLETAVPAYARKSLHIADDSNMKFVLAVAEL